MQTVRYLSLLGAFFAAASLLSAAEPKSAPSARKDKAKSPPPAVTSEQEVEVMQFLRQHHQELADLLSRLQVSHPADYNRAVRELSHTRERLGQFEKIDRSRYDLELQSWVIQSKVQLLVARLAMSDTEALRDELRHLLEEQFDLKVRLSQIERDKIADRLKKLDGQIERLTANRSEVLEREFLSLTKSSEKLKAKRKEVSAAKPAGTAVQ